MTRYKGQSGHEIIQESYLFPVDKYTKGAEALCDKIDVWCGKDPKKSREKRAQRLAGRVVLLRMSGEKIAIPPAAEYSSGLKGLLNYGYIERKKSRKGFKTTKKGKAKIKELQGKWYSK